MCIELALKREAVSVTNSDGDLTTSKVVNYIVNYFLKR